MTLLILLATLPVLFGVLLAGWLGRRRGMRALWLALGCAWVAGAAAWAIASAGAPLAQAIEQPVAVYAPALALAGFVLVALGRRRWTWVTVPLVAVGMAAANLALGQTFFVAGCAASLWECP